jgi:hypothetical protein
VKENLKPQDIYLSVAQVPKSSGSSERLEGDPIPQGKVVAIESFFVIDQTSSDLTIQMGFSHNGVDYFVKREAAGTGAYGIFLNRRLILTEGDKPIAIIESPSVDDVLLLVARGPYLSE